MKIGAVITALLLVFSTVSLVMPDYADAARMGGGRSFGSKPFMNSPAQAPAARQSTQQRQQPAATAQAPRMGGMMGGMLGGLLAGTLLGSLLSGHGFQGGGFMDLILLGILAFIGYMIFKRFRERSRQPAAAGAAPFGGNSQFTDVPQNTSGLDATMGNTGGFTPADRPNVDIPAGFDVEEFLRGAKTTFTRMQKSWDNRDLDDIANFASSYVINQLKEDMAKDPNPSTTEIMLVNAELLGVETSGEEQRAQVYFDVLLREDPRQSTPTSVREIWHFMRIGQNGHWKLDGIQQVA